MRFDATSEIFLRSVMPGTSVAWSIVTSAPVARASVIPVALILPAVSVIFGIVKVDLPASAAFFNLLEYQSWVNR